MFTRAPKRGCAPSSCLVFRMLALQTPTSPSMLPLSLRAHVATIALGGCECAYRRHLNSSIRERALILFWPCKAHGKLAQGGSLARMLACPPWWWRRTWEKEGGWRVDGECEIAITMLPSQAEMRWAQFAFANGRMRTSVFV